MMLKKIKVIMYNEVDSFLDTIRRQYFEAKKLRYGK